MSRKLHDGHKFDTLFYKGGMGSTQDLHQYSCILTQWYIHYKSMMSRKDLNRVCFDILDHIDNTV